MTKFRAVTADVDVDDKDIIDYVRSNFTADYVYPDSELDEWATENGYVKVD